MDLSGANKYGRLMMALLPPGRLWRELSESLLYALFVGIADEFGRVEDRGLDLLEEADPRKAVELLSDYEDELGLEATGSTAERQARVVARRLARQRYRPTDFQSALALLLGQLAADVVVLERTHANALTMDDVREIYRFFIYRAPSLPGAYYLDSAQAIVDKIKPSHTVGHLIESIVMLCDDPYSLCDRDILEFTRPATLATAAMSGGGVQSNAGTWAAKLTWSASGLVGNGKKLDVVLVDTPVVLDTTTYEVRDNQRYNIATAAWVAEAGTVGAAVYGVSLSSPGAVSNLEAAINASSALCQVTTPTPIDEDLAYPGVPTRYTGTFAGGL